MSTRRFIECIERNHLVMGAHVQRLATVSPEQLFTQTAGVNENSTLNVSDLLNASVRGHLQGAANALKAMAEVEVNINSLNTPETSKNRQSITVIDVEASEIDNKEDKS